MLPCPCIISNVYNQKGYAHISLLSAFPIKTLWERTIDSGSCRQSVGVHPRTPVTRSCAYRNIHRMRFRRKKYNNETGYFNHSQLVGFCLKPCPSGSSSCLGCVWFNKLLPDVFCTCICLIEWNMTDLTPAADSESSQLPVGNKGKYIYVIFRNKCYLSRFQWLCANYRAWGTITLCCVMERIFYYNTF